MNQKTVTLTKSQWKVVVVGLDRAVDDISFVLEDGRAAERGVEDEYERLRAGLNTVQLAIEERLE